ncbi:MAG: hypothetical protein Hyperionvirus24_20 [Hyperionvirus sp.]|uniref:Uncharacterized protein n=1 Tax=Hyperionvirus sp. TaxID=2487770 RepID=A0A3G5AAX8_9VIRU|nr:MAG: hypothetical protein Hyperionvirus24_20 [Hyperionvirus sp.]
MAAALASIAYASCVQAREAQCSLCLTSKRNESADNKCKRCLEYYLCRVRATFPDDEKFNGETVFEILVEPTMRVQGTKFGQKADSFPVTEGHPSSSKFTIGSSKELSQNDDEGTYITCFADTLKGLFDLHTKINSLLKKIKCDMDRKKTVDVDMKEYTMDITDIEMEFFSNAAKIRFCSDKRHEATTALFEHKLIKLILKIELEELFAQRRYDCRFRGIQN